MNQIIGHIQDMCHISLARAMNLAEALQHQDSAMKTKYQIKQMTGIGSETYMNKQPVWRLYEVSKVTFLT